MASRLFQEAVSAVLRTWEALNIAVKNEFGGALSAEKARWMESATAQYFHENADLEEDEIEHFLATVVNQEFDTIVEDGSLSVVAKQLCLLYSQCARGCEAEVRDFIQRATRRLAVPTTAAAQKQPSPPPECQDDDDNSPHEEEHEEKMDDEGWEKVTYKSKSRR